MCIGSIINNAELKQYARSFKKGDLYKDVLQHLYLSILEMPKDKVEMIYQNGKLIQFCKSFIYLSFTSDTSSFNKEYNHLQRYVDLKDISEEDEMDKYDPKLLDRVIDRIESRYIVKGKFPFDVMLFRELMKLGTGRAVSKKFNIPESTISIHLANFKKKVIKEYENINKDR